jgi:peptide/nickel transport system substrate-binding protein
MGNEGMIDRRGFLVGSVGASLVSYAGLTAALGAVSRDFVVMAKQIDDILSLDPQESFEFSGNEITGNIYQKLVTPNPLDPAELRGDLAESWEVAPDGLSLTFRMRAGKKFSSGNPVTAEDAAFSLQRAILLNKPPVFILNQFGFAPDNVAERIKAVDPHTLVLRFADRPSPSFLLYCLAANLGAIVDKTAVMAQAKGNDLGNAWLKQNSAGSGCWILRTWRASEIVSLDANPLNPPPGGIKRMIIRHVADPSAQMLLLRQADADIARDLSTEQITTLSTDPGYTIVKHLSGRINYLAMNTAHPMLAKPQVRQAIKWAIDYEAIQKNIMPVTAKVHQAFVPESFPGAITDAPYHKDTAKAKALLAEAGLADGFDLTMDHASVAPTPDIAQIIQANLREAGIRLSLLAGETRQVTTKVRARQHQMAMGGWGSDYFDPNSNAENFCVNVDNSDTSIRKTTAWRNSWMDKDISDRAIAALQETDAAKRLAAYESLQRDVLERGPYAMMVQPIQVAVVRRNVEGLVLGTMSDLSRYEGLKKV